MSDKLRVCRGLRNGRAPGGPTNWKFVGHFSQENRTPVNQSIKHIFTILRAALGVGLLYYVLKVTGGWAAAKQLISTRWLLPWLSCLTIFSAAIEAKRLGFLFGAQGMRLSFVHSYRVVAIGALFNFCIPGGTGGDVMKL